MDKILFFIFTAVVLVTALAGCTGRFLTGADTSPQTLRNEHLVIVRVGPHDTLESLAHIYLGEREKAWWIADYNGIQTAQVGQRLVIPLKPIVYGGLRRDGYQTVPVLLYSKVTANDKESRGISAAQFESQLQYLQRNGYQSISLDALNGFFNLAEQVPPKAIVITFDSAQRWVYEIVYPILKKYGFKAAVFVPTGLIGEAGFMHWSDLAAMSADGYDVGVNGITARDLISISSDEDPAAYLQVLEEEIAKPRLAVSEKLKRPCSYFAYPAGRSNDLIVAMLKKHGYATAFSRQSGSNPFFVDNYMVRRFVITNPISEEQFQTYLTTFVPAELQ